MDVESLAKQLILQNMTPEQQTAVLDSIKASVLQAKDVQKQRIGENVQVVVQALRKIEADIKARYDETGKAIEKRVATIKDGKDGRNGVDGKAGKDGRAGRDGATGPRGSDGLNGNDGRDGVDGVSVTDAHIDFDGSLIISLSSGRIINVGEVVAPDVAEKIKIIANGGGTSQTVIDALASLQTQINELIPSQTGNAGKFLTTDGTDTSWAEIVGGLDYQGTWNATTNTPTLASSVGVNGYYYVVATAGSTNLNGVTDWQIGDWAIYNGTVWQKIDQTNLVTSVAGRTGAITLANTDISGLGTMSTQASSSVSITGGSIAGITDLAIADGGTGQSTATAAFNALAPSQTSNANKYLKTDGTNTSWQVVPEPAAATPTDDGLVFGLTNSTSNTPSPLTAYFRIPFNQPTVIQVLDAPGTGGSGVSGVLTSLGASVGDNLFLYFATGNGYIAAGTYYLGTITSYLNPGDLFISNPNNVITTTIGGGAVPDFNNVSGNIYTAPVGGNTSLGYQSNSNGGRNTIIGYGAGSSITLGSNLTIVGYDSEPTSATATNEATFGNSTTTNTRLFGSLSMGGSSAGTAGQVLTSAGSGTAPTWSTPASSGVTSVTGTSPVVSSGGATPAISLASGYGDTLNPYASKTANYVLAAPNGSAGVPTFRAVVAADIPTLNQSTTGNAATVTTNANLTGAVTSIGNATSLGSFTSAQLLGALTDETGTGAAVFATSPTLVTPALGTPASGVVTNLTGTASININGTVGATTANTGAFTTLSASSTLTVTGAGSIEGLTVGRGAGAVATNTAVGASALAANQAGGTNNTAIGNAALDANTTGDANTAVGNDALGANTTASNNTAVGYQAGYTNVTGASNVFLGYVAGYSSTGSNNIFIGNGTGYSTTGSSNTFIGRSSAGTGSGENVTTGSKNTILGGYSGNQGGLDIRTSSNYIVLSDGDGNPRGIFDNSGNFLVGTTTNVFSTGTGIFVKNANAAATYIGINHNSASSSGNDYVAFGYNSTQIGGVSQNGTTGVLYNLTSDYRLKNNQQPLTGAKDFVMALQPKKWQWWDGSGEGVGFIAHEFMEVAKYSGHGEKDAVDAEGKPIMQSIQPSSSEVMANLVSLIQEQQAIIESLKARLDAANL